MREKSAHFFIIDWAPFLTLRDFLIEKRLFEFRLEKKKALTCVTLLLFLTRRKR